MRISIFVFAASVLSYAIISEGSSIYEMVSDAYQITLVGSFVPLVFGLTGGRPPRRELFEHRVGITTWASLTFIPGLAEEYPAPLCGVLASVFGMIVGSWMPQWIEDRQTDESRMYHVHPAILGRNQRTKLPPIACLMATVRTTVAR